jgi:hypothetical protein
VVYGVGAKALLDSKGKLLFSYCVLDVSCAVWVHALLWVFVM